MAWQGLLGVPVLLAVAWALGERERRIPWRIVGGGLGLQVALAVVLLWLPQARQLFAAASGIVESLQAATRAGTSFVFGYLGGGEPPFHATIAERTFILAFQALPLSIRKTSFPATGSQAEMRTIRSGCSANSSAVTAACTA